MPELPEVETIRRDFNRSVKGRVFKSVKVIDSKIAQFSQAEFRRKIKDQKVKGAKRFAKILVIETESGYGLMIHLKMTGQLIYRTAKGEQSGGGHPDKLYYGQDLPHKYTKIIFRFKDDSELFFNDLRRFGWIRIISTKDLKKIKEIGQLGPEPLLKEFSLEYLEEGLKRRKRSNIKVLLTDQKFISGIGNIYVCESLAKARIDPRKKAGQLKKPETKRLYSAIKFILTKSLKLKGTSDDTYVDLKGKKGGYLPKALVYGREGLKCRFCLGKVEKIKIGNRGTYFCPKCQK